MGIPSTDLERCDERTIDRLSHLLRHASRCEIDLDLHLENPCCVESCFWMKGYVETLKFKQKNGTMKGCGMCTSVMNWSCYHQKYCREADCRVIMCGLIRKAIQAYKSSKPPKVIDGDNAVNSPNERPPQEASTVNAQSRPSLKGGIRGITSADARRLGLNFIKRAEGVAQTYAAGDKRRKENGQHQVSLEDRYLEECNHQLEKREQQNQQRRTDQAAYSRDKECSDSTRHTPKAQGAGPSSANESWVRGKRLRYSEPKGRRLSDQGTRGKLPRNKGVLDQRNNGKGKGK